MSGFLGMDTAAVRDQGSRTRDAAARLEEILRGISAAVADAEWTGPDAEAFRGRFSTDVTAAGARACSALSTYGRDLAEQATEQEQASSTDDGGPGPHAGAPAPPHPWPDVLTATATASGTSDAIGWGKDRLHDAGNLLGGAAHTASDAVGGAWDAVKPEFKTVQPVREDDIDRSPKGLKDPHSTQDLLENLSRASAGTRHTDDHANITVQTIHGPDGEDHYVVYVPGSKGPMAATANPLHEGTNNPMGWDQNGPALMGRNTDSADAVRAAMAAYGVPKGADVTMVGHSQGGIAASNLAADPHFNGGDGYHVSTVVTAGSPVENAQVPRGTQTINFDHQGSYGVGDDPVPNLDGDPSISARLPGPLDRASNRHEVPLYGRSEYLFANHGADTYAQSVGDEVSRHPHGPTARFEHDHLANVVGPGTRATGGADIPVTRR
ncbi:hypothetical protein Bra3105_17085 [Brachybacterium halotolerans subsp. kimchii]|uniref:WXG100 family type VII secretion target n=1 Tax=Brachybacterium halotolerans TaxID=2795215 RepID=UPI001E3344A5|nr:hypothetical protein [Brachybacterium halotolerans]UEJ82520.1 hypothetical protein Bra3105_17085 [Brachybacterium halotolerans subsp. kimchii]